MKYLRSERDRVLLSAGLASLLVSVLPTGCTSSNGSKGSGLAGEAGSEAGRGSDGGASGNGSDGGGTDGGDEPSTGGRSSGVCATSSDCALGEQCVGGECLSEEDCRNSLDCSSLLVCSENGRCVECVDDVECESDKQCVGNACRSLCNSDRNCVELGLLCDRDAGSCVECLVTEDCQAGRECTAGACVTTVLGAGGGSGVGGAGVAGSGNGGSGSAAGGADTGQGGPSLGQGGAEVQGGFGGGSAGVETAGGGPLSGGDAGAGGQLGEGGATTGSAGTPETGGAPGAGGATLGFCGDGLLDAGEACDDGNTQSDDCCSSTCHVESGCECTQGPTGAEAIAIAATHRDFLAGGDFEPSEATGLNDPVTGLVAPTLDADGKPALAGIGGDGFITSAASFAEWYRDVLGTNATLASTLVLYRDANGDYANRYGASGEQWIFQSDTGLIWCGEEGREEIDADGNAIPCTFCLIDDDPDMEGCQGREQTECDSEGPVDACVVEEGVYFGVIVTAYDGNPAFFPVDSMEFTPAAERGRAVIPPYYGSNWGYEPGEPLHNFHFTSEFHFSFQFTGTQVLEVGGDDDVWVFIDGKLAADLGGIHTPVDATVTFDSSGDASTVVLPSEGDSPTSYTETVALGLSLGQVYDVAIFQAERKVESSTFRVKLRNFELGTSQCARQ